MTKAVRTLRAVQWTMLASVLLYGILGEVYGASARATHPTLNYFFTTLGVAVVGAIFVVRRTLVFSAAESLATQPEDAFSLTQWRTGYLATYALCEALALFGLILRFTGNDFPQSAPFYLGGFVLLSFFKPKEPAIKLAPGH